jgi:sugar phosphate isomerase/epimerase
VPDRKIVCPTVEAIAMTYTRRDIGKLALAALPAAGLMGKPNSLFGGVQVGINVPYSYGNNNLGADETLDNTVQLGLSAVELRTQPIESFLGSPAAGRAAPGRRGQQQTPEEQAAQTALAAELKKWRLSRTTDQFQTFRRKFADAGVAIEIVKVDGIDAMDDDVVDYCFVLAKTVGARAISCEIPLSRTKRLGEFADRHKMMVGYHGHTNITDPEAFGRPESWETAITYAKYNGINLDIGHFTAGNSISPVEFLKKHHDRITHIHVKDRKMHNGPNVPFGEGDTPIKEVLLLMQKEKWKFLATIEFEYPIPEGSTRMAEIAKCVAYCKGVLT